MKGYTAKEVLGRKEQTIHAVTTILVEGLQDPLIIQGRSIEIRCHELSRAVFAFFNRDGSWCSHLSRVVDGTVDGVNHSWIETTNRNILDVYSVARLPMVQLIYADPRRLFVGRYQRERYKEGPLYGIEIDPSVVRWILDFFKQSYGIFGIGM